MVFGPKTLVSPPPPLSRKRFWLERVIPLFTTDFGHQTSNSVLRGRGKVADTTQTLWFQGVLAGIEAYVTILELSLQSRSILSSKESSSYRVQLLNSTGQFNNQYRYQAKCD